jgi:hypothetical protein
MTKGSHIRYSEAELAWIERHCTLPRREAHERFQKEFGRDDVSLANLNALCKRNGWITGRDGRLVKGNVPHNRGKKCPPGKGGNHPNARKTQFRKGRQPHNTNFLGHERVSKDGYVEVSIDEVNPHTGFERRYALKHKHLWEQKNGKLPKGMCLKCLDDNRLNTDPDNWVAIPRGALPFLNGHRGYKYEDMPEELKPSVLALARLKAAKSRARKGEPTGIHSSNRKEST